MGAIPDDQGPTRRRYVEQASDIAIAYKMKRVAEGLHKLLQNLLVTPCKLIVITNLIPTCSQR